MSKTQTADNSSRIAFIEKKLATLEKRVALQDEQIKALLATKELCPPNDTLSGVELFRLRQETARQRVLSAERKARKAEKTHQTPFRRGKQAP